MSVRLLPQRACPAYTLSLPGILCEIVHFVSIWDRTKGLREQRTKTHHYTTAEQFFYDRFTGAGTEPNRHPKSSWKQKRSVLIPLNNSLSVIKQISTSKDNSKDMRALVPAKGPKKYYAAGSYEAKGGDAHGGNSGLLMVYPQLLYSWYKTSGLSLSAL